MPTAPAKLVLIDGLTGSGKSTTAQRLWLHLTRHGHPARWFYEHDATHAIWPPDEQSGLVAAGDGLAPAFLAEALPARWRALAADCAATETVTILESTLFQSTVGFLLAMEVTERRIAEHVMAVADIVAGLTPVLVLFRPRDVARALRAACDDRQADDYAAALIAHVGSSRTARRKICATSPGWCASMTAGAASSTRSPTGSPCTGSSSTPGTATGPRASVRSPIFLTCRRCGRTRSGSSVPRGSAAATPIREAAIRSWSMAMRPVYTSTAHGGRG